MNKVQLVEAVAAAGKLTKKDAEKILLADGRDRCRKPDFQPHQKPVRW